MENNETANDIISLSTADGQEIQFQTVAGINYQGKFYGILKPVIPLQGMGPNEALVFEVSRLPDGGQNYAIEYDEDIVNGVFEEYFRLLGNNNKNQ